MESDNHDDSHCFAANLYPILYIRQQCTVALFLPEYFEQTDSTIVTGATDIDTNNGMMYLLVPGKGILLGNPTKKSLIQRNQCQSFGVIICDDLTNKYRSLGIETDDIFSGNI